MSHLHSLNEAMEYIESHLDQKIDMKEVAKKALSSEYEFKRIFSFLSGMTLSDYIRKRRLTLAAMALQKGGAKVIDVANQYGYSSPDAFSRAFERYHHILPSEVRTRTHTLKSCPMMTFRLTIEGGEEMNYRIEEKSEFKVAGYCTEMIMEENQLKPSYDEVLEKLTDERVEELTDLSDREPSGVIHVTTDYRQLSEQTEAFNHYIGAAVSKDYSGNKETHDIKASTWAVFEIEGDWESVEKEWMRIYSEWLPSSNYDLIEGAEILASKENSSEVWIQVKKK